MRKRAILMEETHSEEETRPPATVELNVGCLPGDGEKLLAKEPGEGTEAG